MQYVVLDKTDWMDRIYYVTLTTNALLQNFVSHNYLKNVMRENKLCYAL